MFNRPWNRLIIPLRDRKLLARLGTNLPQHLGLPSRKPRTLGFVAALFFPAAILTGAIAAGAGLPPLVPILLEILFSFLILRTLLYSLGSQANQDHKIAVVVGLIIPVICFGMIASLATPMIIIADLAFAFFIRQLWRKYHASNIGPGFNPVFTEARL